MPHIKILEIVWQRMDDIATLRNPSDVLALTPQHAAPGCAMPEPRRVVSREHHSLDARIVRRLALHYRDGAEASLDRPPCVRAAASMAWSSDRRWL